MAKIKTDSFILNISKLVKTQDTDIEDVIDFETRQALIDVLEATIAEVISDKSVIVEIYKTDLDDNG